MAASHPDGTVGGQRLGCCLDIDGTVHRHGSIFVESLALLPYASDLPMNHDDREALRNVLATVATYAGGERSRRRWLAGLRACDALAGIGLDRGVARLLAALIRRRARRGSSSPSEDDDEDYRDMQRRVLEQYGVFVAGRPADRVEDALEQVIERHVRIDPAIKETIAALTRRDVDVVLVTDVPTHVARPYAKQLGPAVDVVGTDFETIDGRFTGSFTFVEKGAAVTQLRTDREWDRVIAAGDSAGDLAMAEAADLFLAVAGRGTVVDALAPEEQVVDVRHLDSGVPPPTADVVIVPRETSLATPLERAVAAVGLDADATEPEQGYSPGEDQ